MTTAMMRATTVSKIEIPEIAMANPAVAGANAMRVSPGSESFVFGPTLGWIKFLEKSTT